MTPMTCGCRRTSRLSCAALAATLLAGAAAASQPPRARPDRTAAEPAVIRGRVTDADTGAPLTLAQVLLFPAHAGERTSAATDAAGRYELVVPPGRYRLVASKAGYLSPGAGQQGLVGTFLGGFNVVADAGRALEVELELQRGAVLTGTVYNPFGEPAAGVSVQVLRYRFDNGQWQLAGSSRGFADLRMTDDRGVYRIHSLPPGSYYVQASTPTWWMNIGLWSSSGSRVNAPTYYPGTPDLETAERIDIDLGQEVAGIDFRLATVPTLRVAGHVVGEDGQPVSSLPSVSLIRNDASGSRASHGGRSEADGRFAIQGVMPGRYIAFASESGPPGQTRFATAEVVVAGDDVDGVRLTMTTGASARGRIVFDATGTALHAGRTSAGCPVTSSWRASGDILFDSDTSPTLPTTGLQVVLTDRTTTLKGRAVDADGRSTTDYTVVIFPEETHLRLFPSRFVRTARPDQDGAFSISGLPPSQYLAFAAPAIPEGSSSNPEFLASVAPSSARFTLGDGETRDVTLRLGALP